MILAFVATILILAIATYQSIQGAFSALIMALLTMASALAAFSLYEPLCEMGLYELKPAYAEGTTVVAVFLLLLLGLRELADRFIRGNIVFSAAIDRAGGALLGVFSGMVIVGTVLVGMQMLPFGPSVMGYRPFDESMQRRQRVWIFMPDDFVVGMVGKLSTGGLGNDRPLTGPHPDLLRELAATRVRMWTRVKDPDDKKQTILIRAGQLHTEEGSFTIQSVHQLRVSKGYADQAGHIEEILKELPLDPMLAADTPTVPIVVRVRISKSAIDEDGWWRLPATHFQLVDPDGNLQYPVGYLFFYEPGNLKPNYTYKARSPELAERGQGWYLIAAATDSETGAAMVGDLGVHRPDKGILDIDWVFRIPAAADGKVSLRNHYMTFRRRLAKPLPDTVQEFLGSPSEALGHYHMNPVARKDTWANAAEILKPTTDAGCGILLSMPKDVSDADKQEAFAWRTGAMAAFKQVAEDKSTPEAVTELIRDVRSHQFPGKISVKRIIVSFSSKIRYSDLTKTLGAYTGRSTEGSLYWYKYLWIEFAADKTKDRGRFITKVRIDPSQLPDDLRGKLSR